MEATAENEGENVSCALEIVKEHMSGLKLNLLRGPEPITA
jgi:hypothetical protein